MALTKEYLFYPPSTMSLYKMGSILNSVTIENQTKIEQLKSLGYLH